MSVELVKPEIFLVQFLRGDQAITERIRQDPGMALAALESLHGEKRLSLSVQARVLDGILSLVSDPAQARELLSAHLTEQATAEMIAVMGDRPSVASQIVDIQTVLAALEMHASMEDLTSGLEASLLVKALALNLKDRPDWEHELDISIGPATLRELLVAAIYDEYDHDSDDDSDRTPDVWVEVGLNPDESEELLRRLIEDNELPEFTELSRAAAYKRLRERTQAFVNETSSSAIGQIADELDI